MQWGFNSEDVSMDQESKEEISKEMELFQCSILLNELKEKVRRLRAYGVEDAEIVAAMNEEESFPQLVVTEDYKIVLSKNQPVEVKLEPLVKAVYLLFLNHPEGIIFKNLPDYRQELTRIYSEIRPWGVTERAIQSIEDVTNPLLNSINEKCARIKKAFELMLDSGMAKNYYIDGLRGEAKKISLPRDLVVWE